MSRQRQQSASASASASGGGGGPASSGGTKSYQVKAWKEERVKLKGEKNSLQRKLKGIEKRLSELDDLIANGS